MCHRSAALVGSCILLLSVGLPLEADVCGGQLTVLGETISVPAGEPAFIDLLANDSQDCGAPLSVTRVSESCPGFVEDYQDGSITYVPAGDDETCSISYTVESEDGGSATRTAVVTVGSGSSGGGVTDPVVVVDQLSPECPGGAIEKCCWHEIARAIDYRYRQGEPSALPSPDPIPVLNESRLIPWPASQPLSAAEAHFGANSENHALLCAAAKYLWLPAGHGEKANTVAALEDILDAQHSYDGVNNFGWMSREIFSPVYQGWIAGAWLAIYNHARLLADDPGLKAKAKAWLRTYWTMNTLSAGKQAIETTEARFRTLDWIVPSTLENPQTWFGLSLGTAGSRAGAHLPCLDLDGDDDSECSDSNGDGIGDGPDAPIRAVFPRIQVGHSLTALALNDFPRDLVSVGIWERDEFYYPLWVATVFAGSDWSAAEGGSVDLPNVPSPPEVFGLSLQEQDNLRSFVNSAVPSPQLLATLVGYVGSRRPRCEMTFLRTESGSISWFGAGVDPGGQYRSQVGCNQGQTGFPVYALALREGGARATFLTPEAASGSAVTSSDRSMRVGNQICWEDDTVAAARCIDIPAGETTFQLGWTRASGLTIEAEPPPLTATITIDSHPQDFAGVLGGNAFFEATASVDEPVTLSYSWRRTDGQPVTGTVVSIAGGSRLEWANLVQSDATSYYCEVSAPGAATVASDTAALTVSDEQPPVVTERFELSAGGPAAGDPLGGEPSDSGGRLWSANSATIRGSAGANGYVTHTAPGEALAVGTVPFAPGSLPGSQVLTVGADVSIEGPGWVALGFSDSPSGSFIGSGQVWVLLRENGDFSARQNGTTVNLGDCNSPACTAADFTGAGAWNRLKVQYDTQLQVFSAWVNREKIFDQVAVDTQPQNLPQIASAGFALTASTGGAAERIKVDNFWAVAGAQSGEFEDAGVEASDVPLFMGCGDPGSASVTVRNVGNTAWYRVADGTVTDPAYKWGHPQADPFTALDRVWLEAGERVLPGEARSFGWGLTAPTVAGDYPIFWRMIREDFTAGPPPLGIDTWFGEPLDVTINVDCDNLPPTPVDDPRTVEMNESFRFSGATLISNDTDPDDDEIFFVDIDWSYTGTAGTVEPVSGAPSPTYDYFTPPGVHGFTDTVRYIVEDEHGARATGSLIFNIPINHRPVPVDDALSTPANVPVMFTAGFLTENDTDQDSDLVELASLVLAAVTPGQSDLQPLAGVSPTAYEFVPPAGGVPGDFVFEYLIVDEHGLAGAFPGELTITVFQQAPVAADDRFLVPYGGSLQVRQGDLLANDTDPNGDPLWVPGHGAAAFGALFDTRGDIVYIPNEELWNAGGDAFTYQVTDGYLTSQATVHLLAEPACDTYLGDGFETGDLSAWAQTVAAGGGIAAADPAAAAEGGYGLSVAPAATTTSLYVEGALPAAERHFRMRLLFNPNAFAMEHGAEHSMFSALELGSNAFSLRLANSGGVPRVRLAVSRDIGAPVVSASFDLADDTWHRLFVDWWAASAPGLDDGGARLWIDGVLAAEVLGIDNDALAVDRVRLGAPSGLDPGSTGSYFFDSYASCDGPRSRRTLKADGFESGDLSAWDDVVQSGTGSVAAAASAALDGAFGLEVSVDAGSSELYVLDETPAAERSLWAEVSFDASGFTMGLGAVPVLEIEGAGPGSALAVSVRSGGGGLAIGLSAADDTGGVGFQPPSAPLSPGVHHLLVQLSAASRPGEADGSARFWLDGQAAGAYPSLSNSSQVAQRIRLGAVAAIPAGSAGTLRFDGYHSWTRRDGSMPRQQDTFESGGLAAWDVVVQTGGGTLAVTPAAALEGGLGLEVGLADGAGQVHVRKDLEVSASGLTVEFAFDPNSVAMASGSAHPIFHAGADSGGALSLTLMREFGLYQLRIQAVEDCGSTVLSGPAALSDQPHVLRLEFRRAAAPGLPDGSLRLWVDGMLIHSISGLDNATKAVNTLRLGAIWQLDPGTAGNLYFDDFKAW